MTKLEIPKFLPTLTLSSLKEANTVCSILKSSNINSIEVTLRSSFSIEAIKYIADETSISLGLGTVLDIKQLEIFKSNKIDFAVSPGFDDQIAEYCLINNINYVPGVETSTEVMYATKKGLTKLKFFPAEQSGGVEKLKAFQAVFPEISFMCTGGISLNNYKKYIELENVFSVGGSFVLPKNLLNESDQSQAKNYLGSL